MSESEEYNSSTYPSSQEKEILDTRFKDKDEDWLKVRAWIHGNPMIARDSFIGMANKEPKFLDIIHDFDLWARPEQLNIDTSYTTTMVLCGRGWGKSWFSAFYAVDQALKKPNTRIAFFAADYGSLKRVNWMSDSGILKAIHPKVLKECTFNKSDLTLDFPNGSSIVSYSAESFDKTRGDSVSICILDELASWTYAKDALAAARLILRKGSNPHMVITTTPRPTEVIKELAKDPDVNVITGTTHQNYYLPKSYANDLKKKLTSRLYSQEALGEILSDNLYALFSMQNIIKNRVDWKDFDHTKIRKYCIAIDPAVTSNESSDLTGIVVAGIGYDGHYYIFEDATMSMATPEQWSSKVIRLYKKYNKYPAPTSIVAEVNNGGDLITSVIRNASRRHTDIVLPPVKVVRASRGKEIRAEPVAALYEQDVVHHVGEFSELEVQQTDWNPTDKNAKSPDRLDALVWNITALSKGFSAPIESGYGSYNSYSSESNQDTDQTSYCGYY